MEGLILIGVILWLLWALQPNKDSWWEHYKGSKMSGAPLEDETFTEFLEKSILKPNNINFPLSRIEFGNLIK